LAKQRVGFYNVDCLTRGPHFSKQLQACKWQLN